MATTLDEALSYTPATALGKKWTRRANTKYRKGAATLSAYERLFPGTVAMTARSKDQFNTLEAELFNKYAPAYAKGIDAVDPEQGMLRKALTQQVTADLNSPDITPSIARAIQQGNRSAWSSRGLAQSPASAIDELFAMGERGNQLQQQKYQNASSMLGLNNQLVTAPTLNVMQRTASVGQPNYASFNDDLFSFGVNNDMAKQNREAAKDAGQMTMIGQGLSGAATLAGALFCWLAREVYGEANPRWKQFRRWLLDEAPRELFDWYRTHGQRAAAKLKRHPELKPAVREWMDAKLAAA